jgi:hypothetical protein
MDALPCGAKKVIVTGPPLSPLLSLPVPVSADEPHADNKAIEAKTRNNIEIQDFFNLTPPFC